MIIDLPIIIRAHSQVEPSIMLLDSMLDRLDRLQALVLSPVVGGWDRLTDTG
jgi:hypothetical protein